MAKNKVNTKQPLNAEGVDASASQPVLNQTHIERDPVQIYLERAPYSKTSKVSEVFGPRNQSKINTLIESYTKMYDYLLESGDKEAASHFESGIKRVHTQLQHLSNLKDEWMMMRGGGMRGKSTVSNITDQRWPDLFFTEKGNIDITEDWEVICTVPELGFMGTTKKIEDIPLDWESKGDGEGRYMSGIQDMQEAGARGDKNPPFDVDYFTSNLLDEFWPQALSDKWGGVYALHDILPKMIEKNGGTMEGLDVSIEAFNPKRDLKLHNYYANRLKKAYNPDYKDNTEGDKSQTETENGREVTLQQRLEAKGLVSSDQLTHKTQSVIKEEKQTHGRI